MAVGCVAKANMINTRGSIVPALPAAHHGRQGEVRCGACGHLLVDELTGVLERSAWTARVGRVLDQPGPASVAIVDLDRFKRVNDRYGHPAGDVVLDAVATLTLEVVGDDGLVGR